MNFQDGAKVMFNIGEEILKGKGIIRGIAANAQPPLGFLMIVEVTESSPQVLPNETYPFRFIAVPENMLQLDV